MKNKFILTAFVAAGLSAGITFGIMNDKYQTGRFFENYLTRYTFEDKLEMRISEEEAIKLFKSGKAILVDVRFPDEHQALNLGFGHQIPLNELPDNLHKLPKDKIIITGCLINERANMARMYLRANGYNAKHLINGIPGMNKTISDPDRQELYHSMVR